MTGADLYRRPIGARTAKVQSEATKRRAAYWRTYSLNGTPGQKEAVELAKAGYGWEEVQFMAGISIKVARQIVLGLDE